MKKIIDCHTHLQTKELIKEYFKRSDNAYAITMKALDCLIGNGDKIYQEIKNCKQIFLCESIDAFSQISITEQLRIIKKHMANFQIIGIKIYLGYQAIFADDPKLFEVYKFCERNNLSVVFHCGVGASNLYSDVSKNYSSSLPIGRVAKKFPNVNFIASHFDWPNFSDCLKVITENKNVYTDISGEYENFDNLPYSELINMFITQLTPHLNKYKKEKIVNKIMFGTDYFGLGSGFDAIKEYIDTLDILFGKEYKNLYLYQNCINAYPKINEFINKKSEEEFNR